MEFTLAVPLNFAAGAVEAERSCVLPPSRAGCAAAGRPCCLSEEPASLGLRLSKELPAG